MTPIEAVFAVIIFFVGLLAGRMGAALIDLKVRRDPRPRIGKDVGRLRSDGYG